jgi:hypothetical protein
MDYISISLSETIDIVSKLILKKFFIEEFKECLISFIRSIHPKILAIWIKNPVTKKPNHWSENCAPNKQMTMKAPFA